MTTISLTRSIALPRRRKMSPLARREARWGLIFISPWLIGFVLFTLLPTIATLIFSFTNINLSSSAPFAFVGLKNYQDMLADAQVWASLRVTFTFAADLAARDHDRAVPRRADAQQCQPARRDPSSGS